MQAVKNLPAKSQSDFFGAVQARRLFRFDVRLLDLAFWIQASSRLPPLDGRGCQVQ